MKPYQAHLDSVIENIEKARLGVSAHHIVKLVAVSKYSTAQEIQALWNVGQRAFGENKVQDLISKSKELDALPLEWHFIGHLQKNKIHALIEAQPFLVHSLDSFELALALEARLQEPMDMLLQINSAQEATKGGFAPDAARDAYLEIQQRCTHIRLKGVMTIGAHTTDEKIIQKSFQTTKAIFDTLPDATICSMGMSSDYKLAIACGSNMVRIGSALFS